MLTISDRTHIAASFTHNCLLRHQPGPDIALGGVRLESYLISGVGLV